MNWDVLGKGWEWVSWGLERPAVYFAAAVNYAPKTALVIAALIALKAMF